MPRPFVFDMETGDPDDFLTLALLGGHPDVSLRAVTVTPGTPEQVGVVRWGLEQLGLNIPVGAWDLDYVKGRGTPDERAVSCVSAWHFKTFGPLAPSRDAEPGWRVLDAALGPDTTLVTGAPLKNVGALLRHTEGGALGRIVIQGGFAGQGVVPPDKQLPKFAGRTTCPTYNLNGDVKSAKAVLACDRFSDVRLVSKNVCHGVVYDAALHARVEAVPNPGRGLALMMRGMRSYLKANPGGKKFHDPLAACCAVDPEIATWAEVEVYRAKGEWGARLSPGSGRRIIVDYDHERFVQVLTRTAP